MDEQKRKFNQQRIFSLLKEQQYKHLGIDHSNKPKNLDDQLWEEAEEISFWLTPSQLTNEFIEQWLDLYRCKPVSQTPPYRVLQDEKSEPNKEHDKDNHVTNYGSPQKSSTRFINFT
jgi:hypothetical protein